MERDMRITGVFRGQSDAVEAPAGFEGMSYAMRGNESNADLVTSQQQVEGQYPWSNNPVQN
jgi:hypothetical protein